MIFTRYGHLKNTTIVLVDWFVSSAISGFINMRVHNLTPKY